MQIDLHTHTGYSYDAEAKPVEAHVQAAVEHGISVLGFSEHTDFFYQESLAESDFAPGLVDFPMYQREVEPFRSGRVLPADIAAQQNDIAACREAYQGKIILRNGIELGQPHTAPDLADELLEKFSFDYVIGSIHHLSDDMDMYFVHYEQKNPDEVMEDYFSETDKMLQYGKFHILGHIDYPLRVMKLPYNKPSLKGYMNYVDEILKQLIVRGIALECNTKSLFGWQKALGPEDCVLSRYRELGGELITVGSDSHAPETIARGIPQALERLKQFGFSYITDFEDGKPIQHKL
ncbi:MAG: histidinol-phosphatase HisJ family protein [Eubacteriales bacterium]|nr:histidinol-phosphatase HisJ family protein [Eubacteriales bacterium]